MQITLPPEAQAIIERKIASGEYATAEDVIAEAVRLLDLEPMPYDPMTDPNVLESIAQADRGDVVAWTDELRQEIRVRALEDARVEKPVPDDLTY